MQQLNYPFAPTARQYVRITAKGLKVFVASSILEEGERNILKAWKAGKFLLTVAIHDSAILFMVTIDNVTFTVEVMRSEPMAETEAWLSAGHSSITLVLMDESGNSLVETEMPVAAHILSILRQTLALQCTCSLAEVKDSFGRIWKTMP